MRELRDYISENCGSEFWEFVTGKNWNGDTGFEIWLFEHDVDFDGDRYRVVILRKDVFDADFPNDVDYSEDIYCEYWRL